MPNDRIDHSSSKITTLALGAICALLLAGAGCSSDSSSPGDASDTDSEKDTATPDTSSQKRAVGAACTEDAQCEGGTCLKEFQILDTVTYIMKNGYCSVGCDRTGADYVCDEGLECQFSKTAQFCFKKCAAPADCRQGEGYECATGNICFPKEAR